MQPCEHFKKELSFCENGSPDSDHSFFQGTPGSDYVCVCVCVYVCVCVCACCAHAVLNYKVPLEGRYFFICFTNIIKI